MSQRREQWQVGHAETRRALHQARDRLHVLGHAGIAAAALPEHDHHQTADQAERSSSVICCSVFPGTDLRVLLLGKS